MIPDEVILKILDFVKSLIDMCMNTEINEGFRDCDKVLKSFRARAREMPSLMFTNGFAYAITYIAARSSSNAIDIGLTKNNHAEIIQEIFKSNKHDNEEAGYALYGALLALALKTTGLVKESSFPELVRSFLNNPVLEISALAIADWIKRFAEALISMQ